MQILQAGNSWQLFDREEASAPIGSNCDLSLALRIDRSSAFPLAKGRSRVGEQDIRAHVFVVFSSPLSVSGSPSFSLVLSLSFLSSSLCVSDRPVRLLQPSIEAVWLLAKFVPIADLVVRSFLLSSFFGPFSVSLCAPPVILSPPFSVLASLKQTCPTSSAIDRSCLTPCKICSNCWSCCEFFSSIACMKAASSELTALLPSTGTSAAPGAAPAAPLRPGIGLLRPGIGERRVASSSPKSERRSTQRHTRREMSINISISLRCACLFRATSLLAASSFSCGFNLRSINRTTERRNELEERETVTKGVSPAMFHVNSFPFMHKKLHIVLTLLQLFRRELPFLYQLCQDQA